MKKFEGKTVVITGGNSGIGAQTARQFIAEGAQVIVTGRDESTLKSIREELGQHLHTLKVDVRQLNQLDQLAATVGERFGKVDILFANAGLGEMRSVEQTSIEIYDRIMDVNVKGVFYTVQKLLPFFNDGASIILNSSIVNNKGMENFSVYNASKAAVRSFARSFTSDLKQRKIRVNSISPGPIETPFFSKTDLKPEQLEQMVPAIAAQVPMGRFGKSEEIASTVLWLASSESSFVTGIDLPVDGGMGQV